LYAIVDVESTGGKFNEEGITEVAIYRFDGHEVVDQFASLVNPERPIDPFVTKLTGINNKMLVRAPKFFEVAKRITEITQDVVLVAHNADFDLRMLQLEFDRLGYNFNKTTLCTVELSQKLLPDAPSYSLGKLVKSLGIPISNRHRATGDALATVELFKVLLNKDLNKNIIQSSLKRKERVKLAPNLKVLIDNIPSVLGVYYVYDNQDELIYVGKSKNIKSQVNRHFTKPARVDKQLRKEVQEITFDKTGNELIASIKEHEAITSLKPKLNRNKTKRLFNHAITVTIDKEGFKTLNVSRVVSNKEYAMTFSGRKSALSFLERLIEEEDICASRTNLDIDCDHRESMEEACCIQDVETYNNQVDAIITRYSLLAKTAVISGKGRNPGEKGVLFIEHGDLQGYAFTNLQIQVVDRTILKQILIPINQKEDGRHLVEHYLRTHNNRYRVKYIDQ
jgi:DNA polymerase-3 subunit epsilon